LNILQTNFHRGWGGQPARILMLSAGLRDRGHRVTLAVPRGSLLAERARAAGLEVFDGPGFLKPKHLLGAARDVSVLAAHLRERRYDVIDAHGSQDLWTCAVALRIAGRTSPLVFTRHNTKRVTDHVFNRWLYGRQIDHLIVVSRSVLERYASFFRRGVLTMERVSIVPSAYRPDRFKTPGTQVNVGTKGDIFVLTEDQRDELQRINRERILSEAKELGIDVSDQLAAAGELPSGAKNSLG